MIITILLSSLVIYTSITTVVYCLFQQIILSHYRHGDIKDAENLSSKLYDEHGDDEVFQCS